MRNATRPAGPRTGAHLLYKQASVFFNQRAVKASDTLILLARTRRAPKLVFYIQSIQSLMLFVCDITGMPPMFTDAPNHIGFANFCLGTLFHFSVSSGRENIILHTIVIISRRPGAHFLFLKCTCVVYNK